MYMQICNEPMTINFFFFNGDVKTSIHLSNKIRLTRFVVDLPNSDAFLGNGFHSFLFFSTEFPKATARLFSFHPLLITNHYPHPSQSSSSTQLLLFTPLKSAFNFHTHTTTMTLPQSYVTYYVFLDSILVLLFLLDFGLYLKTH